MGVDRHRRRSLARKYTVFTVLLLVWAAAVQMVLRLRQDVAGGGRWWDINGWELAVIVLGPLVVAALVGRFTHRVLARPLAQLEQGIAHVRAGSLEPVQVSTTGDEIQFLGESINTMIEAIAASRREVTEHQQLLEERIEQRTEALQEAMGRALAASKAKSEFLANVSHELRTPMNGVLGMLDIVLDGELSEGQREQVETAKNCAQTLLALLNDLLDLSKIEAGRMLLESIPFSIRDVIDGCLLAMSPKALEKGLDLRTKVSADVPPALVGDPLRSRQILMNLMSNAVKFTERGSVEVDVSTGKRTAGQLVLQIAVSDTGPGIPPDKLQAIFDEFTQADGSVSRRFGGTGLGLAITRRLVELHEGTIRVESEVGKGSRFLVDLVLGYVAPAAPEGKPETGASAEAVEPEAQQSSSGDRILVVEDNSVNQKVVNAVLSKHGFQVHSVLNGALALEALEKQSFDLILMDVQMPVMDGLTASRRIRSTPRWRDIPIVAMTAHAMRGDRERCLEAGMDDYLAKPVAPALLVEAVRENLKRPRRRPVPAIADVPPVNAPALSVPAMEAPVLDKPAAPDPQPVAREEATVQAAGEVPPPAAPEPVSASESIAVPEPPTPPIDSERASRLMGGDEHLQTGLALLFLQLAPERIGKLHSAVLRGDALALRAQALKLQNSAERIAATDIASCAASIAALAPTGMATPDGSARITALLARLETEIGRLDEYMRPEREAFEEAANHVFR
jgi:signal transduction histidine kinase/CheY-like chemotaxis protein